MTDSDWLQHLEDRSLWERLSPAAKAVTDAAASAQWEQDAGGMRLSDVQEIVAAALRAAVVEIDAPLSITHVPEQQQRWYGLGVANYKRKLLAIAAELEGAQATGSTH